MRRLDARGFTVTELLVVISISSLLITMVFGFWYYFWQYGMRSQAGLDIMSDRLNASDAIRESISASSGLITQNSISDSNVHVDDSANPGLGFWEPIHAIPGNKSGTGYIPVLFYRKPAITTSNQIAMNGAAPFEDEFILFIKSSDNTMYLRTLANPAVLDNKLLSTCPEAAATALCPADQKILTNLSSVDLRFFSRAGTLIDYTSSVDPISGEFVGPDFPVVEVVELKLNVTKTVLGEPTNPIANSTIVRIALRNT